MSAEPGSPQPNEPTDDVPRAGDALRPDDQESVPPHGDPPADVAIVPVTDVADPEELQAAEPAEAVADAAAAHLAELKQSLGELQLAGTAATGVPAVDEALARLGEIDPDDLAGSAQVLSDVLERLEGALADSRQE